MINPTQRPARLVKLFRDLPGASRSDLEAQWVVTTEFLKMLSEQMDCLNSLPKEERERPVVQQELRRLRRLAVETGNRRYSLVAAGYKERVEK